jgi:hypothetical protein
MQPENPQRLTDAMQAAGFELRVALTDAFIATTRVMPFLHHSSGLPLDLVLAGPGLEERFLERAIIVDFGDGVRVPVISPEDLIVTKLLSARAKDIDDVRGILRERRGRLDLASIRDTLRLLESALGVSDLLPAFESELSHIGRSG